MNVYNDFNAMFNAQVVQKQDMGVFNSVTQDGDEEGGYFTVGVAGSDYLRVYYYGDRGINKANQQDMALLEKYGDTYSKSGQWLGDYNDEYEPWIGVSFLDNYTFDDNCGGDDLVETLVSRIAESSNRVFLDSSPGNDVDFDFPLSKKEAFRLAVGLDACIQNYIKRHPESV